MTSMNNTEDDNTFEIIQISADLSEDLEQLGARPKFWFTYENVRTMFKADHRDTGEDWAEVIAAEICVLLGVPHVPYRLAFDTRNNLPGVLCPNIAAKPLTLVLGNQLMVEADPNYPADNATKYKVKQHTVAAVAEVVAKLNPPPDDDVWQGSDGCRSALDVFVGYVMLDTLIANQDRHHQNWGAIRYQRSWLSPTFDHGAGLARNEPETKRERRLSSPNRQGELEAFAGRAQSGFYESIDDTKTLRSLSCFLAWRAIRPVAADVWIGKLGKLQSKDFKQIIDRIPKSRMTPTAKEFTLELLLINQKRILQVRKVD